MLVDVFEIAIAIILVLLNGFFVAAEFALIKTRLSKIEILVRQGRPFAKTARWLIVRLDGTLSSAQLGITMASLGLGWIGEPAFARLLGPLLTAIGVESEAVLHGIAFAVAFTIITALHLVIGEQAPKIFAIRRPERVALACAVPMQVFYFLSFPLLVTLNVTTAALLRKVGIEGAGGHDTMHSEDEIRAMLRQAHLGGTMTRMEHRLLNAVFEFDDLVCRRVMVPRGDVVFFDAHQTLSECLALARSTKHSRYPLCEGSLDHVLGVVHVKDLVGVPAEDNLDLRSIMRPAQRVPETLPVSRLLRQFQATQQHLAMVVDEHGTVAGAVTLENVLEQIVGPLDDEFDSQQPDIVRDGPGRFIVRGQTLIETVNQQLDLHLEAGEVDTISGLLVARLGRILKEGDRVELDSAVAHVLEVDGDRALHIRMDVSTEDVPAGETDDPDRSSSETLH